jgi:hypothetical protein
MLIRSLLLCATLLACGVSSASATMRISDDRGGQIGQYLQAFAAVRATGEPVIVDGNCLSACTLVLGLSPRRQICATPRARFGFHAAWMPDLAGRPVTSALGTQALWKIYPASVRRWISRHGGLSSRMIYLEGNSLNGVVSICERPTWRVYLTSGRGYSGRSSRYISARAANDRRDSHRRVSAATEGAIKPTR